MDLATHRVTSLLVRLQFTIGAVAQLIERYIRIVEAEGLSPFSSTIRDLLQTFRLEFAFYYRILAFKANLKKFENGFSYFLENWSHS